MCVGFSFVLQCNQGAIVSASGRMLASVKIRHVYLKLQDADDE